MERKQAVVTQLRSLPIKQPEHYDHRHAEIEAEVEMEEGELIEVQRARSRVLVKRDVQRECGVKDGDDNHGAGGRSSAGMNSFSHCCATFSRDNLRRMSLARADNPRRIASFVMTLSRVSASAASSSGRTRSPSCPSWTISPGPVSQSKLTTATP